VAEQRLSAYFCQYPCYWLYWTCCDDPN